MNLSDQEKMYLGGIESLLEQLRQKHPDDKVTIVQYIAGGNRIDIKVNNNPILLGLNYEQAYYAIAAIHGYASIAN